MCNFLPIYWILSERRGYSIQHCKKLSLCSKFLYSCTRRKYIQVDQRKKIGPLPSTPPVCVAVKHQAQRENFCKEERGLMEHFIRLYSGDIGTLLLYLLLFRPETGGPGRDKQEADLLWLSEWGCGPCGLPCGKHMGDHSKEGWLWKQLCPGRLPLTLSPDLKVRAGISHIGSRTRGFGESATHLPVTVHRDPRQQAWGEIWKGLVCGMKCVRWIISLVFLWVH